MHLDQDYEEGETKPNLYHVEFEGMKPQVALLDTGATTNLIHSNLVKNIPSFVGATYDLFGPDDLKIGTLNRYVCLDWCNVMKNIKLYICDVSPYPVVLGKHVLKPFLNIPPHVKELSQDEVTDFRQFNSMDLTELVFALTEIEDSLDAEGEIEEPIEKLRAIENGNFIDDPETPVENARTRYSFEKHVDLKYWFQDFLAKNSDIIHNNPPIKTESLYEHQHPITLKDPSKIHCCAPYKKSARLRAELSRHVEELLKNGFIQKSHSRFASPTILVPKPDHSTRLCIDYRQLNTNTVKDKFPLPIIEGLLEYLHDCKCFSKLDLSQGYYQVAIAPEDREKTAFITHDGLYEWNVMPFGLCNAPATFQRIMNSVLQGFIGKFVVVYLDDILIYSRDFEEHKNHLTQVMDALRKHHFIVKKKKCAWFMKQIEFLGHIISAGGVRPTQSKIEAVQKWECPRTPKGMRSFIGFVSYLRKFIPKFAQIVRPLNLYALKKIPFDESFKDRFKKLQELVTSAPILVPPTPSGTYIVTTDASDYAVGSVIQTTNLDGKPTGVVAYYSQSLSTAEQNYPIREKELLAIIRTLERYKHILLDHHLVIRTDHHSLQFILSQKKEPSKRIARWLDLLSEFDLEIGYIKGETNIADTLSRSWEHTFTLNAISVAVHNQVLGGQFFQDVQENYQNDMTTNEVFETLTNRSVSTSKYIKHYLKNFQVEDGYLYYNGTNKYGEMQPRLWIPTPALQRIVMDKFHNAEHNSHPGGLVTYLDIHQFYYWPYMEKDIKRFVSKCPICLSVKPGNTLTNGLIQPLPIPQYRWQSVSLDFISGFPRIEGKDQILVVVDRFTKRAHFIPCTKTVTARGTARLFMENVVKHHGFPEEIVSDNDIRFTGHWWQEFFQFMGIHIVTGYTTQHKKGENRV
ncbi:uncharacterized protein J8A68_000666 [[Candida] subhashii]|uniref:Reverse transcriptase n=1 Tax=[Candida] subhashii TaxID=561895 RepID=A0A8J5V185_9ASCO|nr:uncharacterized protein J8A68_000666 [[Candida] subhashii]KAG7665840.1 hypothetical protein J8A68_000666 [[Candida] subhashii]